MRSAVFTTVALAALTVAGESKPVPVVGARLADWSLPRADTGAAWSLAVDGADAKAVVVAFLGTECPISNTYVPVLSALAEKYKDRGVRLVGVYSNLQDDAALVAKHAKEFSITFPVLKDERAVLADRFAAKRTPEVFVLDGTRTVRYRGRVDDQFDKGVKRIVPGNRELVDALEAVLAGEAVTRAVTEPAGCIIGRKPKARTAPAHGEAITYSKQVARILQKNCQECHRPGEAAPFKLMNCDDATAWSQAIREAVTDKRMPPWFADDSDKGKFKNDRTLSDEDRTTLLSWIDQGCPEGNPADLPAAREYRDGWALGKPDQILTMSEAYHVPAVAPKGGVPYQYFFVGEPFQEDKWVQSMEAVPGVRGVVHHILVLVKPPSKRPPNPKAPPIQQIFTDFDFKNPDGFGAIFLGGYAPGAVPFAHGPGFGKKIPKGSQLVFEMHYTPNGTACSDRSSIGLIFCKEPPKHEIRTRTVMTEKFYIPPYSPDTMVEQTSTFDRPVVVTKVGPHMHLRGKSFNFDLTDPAGKTERLLTVPKYDFNWQLYYEFTEPRHLAKGSQIRCEAHYDNSAKNPNNPNPLSLVTFGLQTWEEMMVGFVDYYDDDGK